MDDKVIFTKLTPDGRTVEVRVHDYHGTATAHLYLDGEYIEGPALPGLLPPSKVRGDITHYLGGGLPTERKLAVGFTRAEVRLIKLAISVERLPPPNPRRLHASPPLSPSGPDVPATAVEAPTVAEPQAVEAGVTS